MVARLGLVGLGRWGRRYVETIGSVPGAELRAVATSRDQVEGLPPGCLVVRSWRRLAEAPLDGVVLAVPPQLHREIAEQCIARRMPVLVEKPMATGVEDAGRLAAAAHAAGVFVLVDHTHLFSPAFRRLRDLVGAGPLAIRGEGGNDGPVGRPVAPLWDWGPHDVAMCLALTGAPPTSVEARRQVTTADGRELIDLTLRFARGDEARLTVGNGMPRKRRSFQVDDGDQVLRYDDLAPDKLVRSGPAGDEPVEVPAGRPLDQVVTEFVAGIESGAGPHPSVDLGVDVVRVLNAAERAASRSGRGRPDCA
jgi:predicted dehydrogenase